jgi:hypothetical protein
MALLTLAAAAACALAVGARAFQDEKPRPTRLSLKLVMYEGAGPTFYALGDADGAGGGAVAKNFRSLASARFRSAPVHTLVINFSRKGDGARAVVYAQSGADESFREEKVAEYVMGEGDEYAVAQLSAYGVEPLRLGVVRRAEVELKPPSVQNRTRAVEVVEIKIHEDAPSFELTLKNVSTRDVSAVEIEERRGWEPKGAPPLFNWKSLPLIKPGKTFKVVLEFGWNSKLAPEGHVVEPADTVVINSALFSDGGYEGSSLFAAQAQAFRVGRRAQLERALEVMRGWDEPPAYDTREVAKELASKVLAFECAAEWETVTELAGRYSISQGAELDRIKSYVEEGMQWQRSALMRELIPFVRNEYPSSDPRALRDWMKATRERFELMLAGV